MTGLFSLRIILILYISILGIHLLEAALSAFVFKNCITLNEQILWENAWFSHVFPWTHVAILFIIMVLIVSPQTHV